MLDFSFIWLLISHFTVFFPLYIGFQQHRRKWIHSSICLFLTSIVSTIYHIPDLPTVDKDKFLFLGMGYNVYSGLDFFGSYFSILIILFSVIHPYDKSEYCDIILVLIAFFSCFFSITLIPWYYFILFLFFICLLYGNISKETSLIYILRMLYRFRLYSILGFITLFLSIFMQYFFALFYDTENYPVYHGFWHFFMFLSSGFWIKWNNQLIDFHNFEDENRN